MIEVKTLLDPRMFAQIVMQEITNNDPSLVSDGMIAKFNEWLAIEGNNKESFTTSDVENLVEFIYSK